MRTVLGRIFLGAILGIAITLAVAIGGDTARAYEPQPGAALHRACAGQSVEICLTYIAAVMDLHNEVIGPQMGRMFCPPDNPDPREAGRAVWQWYKENPEDAQFPAIYGAIGALARLYPCE